MNDNVFIDTILEAQAILARHIRRRTCFGRGNNRKLMQLLDSSELGRVLIKSRLLGNR